MPHQPSETASDAGSASVLAITGVEKTFLTSRGERLKALETTNLELKVNEFVCVVGPSGCGKSTLLRMTAGLESCETGSISFMGTPVVRPRREIGMVFQEYSLLPWRSVLDNVAMGPEFAGGSRADCVRAAEEFLQLVGLSEFAQSYPHELSGGMRQRVAIARALANRPELLLMDEPFGALDAHTRILLQRELLKICQKHATTILFVTHSVDEAVYLADRIVVMSPRPGRIKRILSVDLPHPRSRGDARYAALSQHILELLES
ncbi:MAG: ABC transporter ATP-binding protein [Desulfovibrio sp.]|nr:ABC transporter ATP-binding protein [Desulfovibrio sp.]